MEETSQPRIGIIGEPKWLQLLFRLSSKVNWAAAVLAAVLLVLMVLLILVEIALRFFSLSTFMTDVLVGRGVAAITFLALAWALQEGSMIRIGVLTNQLNNRLQLLFAGFAIAATEVLTVWLISFQFNATLRLWSKGTTSEHHLPIPLWIPESFFLLGLTLMAFTLLIQFMRLLITGQMNEQALNI